MKKRIVEWIVRWLIEQFLDGMHRHLNPTHKKSDFVSPPPEFSTEGEKNGEVRNDS